MSKKCKSKCFRRHTPEVWSALKKEFERWTREKCASGAGRVFLNEAQVELRLGQQAATRLADEAIEEGWLVERSPRTGFSVRGLVAPESTMAGLLAFACEHQSDQSAMPAGRQRADGPREIHGLSKSQLTKITTAAAFVAEHVSGDRKRLSAVGQEHFRWLDNGGVGANGTWELVEKVREWAKDLGASTREAHVSAMRNLLDLCATLGRLTRGDTPRLVLEVEAVEWSGWIQRVVEAVADGASDPTRYETGAGARVLARFATRRGWLALESVDWAKIIGDLASARDDVADPLPARHYRLAYTVYRKLRKANLVDGPDLRGSASPENPAGLVKFAALKNAASQGDFSAWRTRDGRPATALAADLSRWHVWADKRTTTEDFNSIQPPLPARERVNPTSTEAKRAAKRDWQGRPEFRLSESSLTNALVMVSDLAGWASDSDDYDPESQGLEKLIDLERFDRRAAAWREAHDREPNSRGAYLSQMASYLGTIASPFLEREATQRGDCDAQATLANVGVHLQVRSIKLQPHEDERADALDKVRLWQLDGGDGWSKLNRLVEVLERRAIAEGNGLSIEDQVASIRAGAFRPRRIMSWAVAVRDVVFVNLVRRVPLRGENASGLRLAPLPVQNRRHGRSTTRTLPPNWITTDLENCPWRGGIQLSFDSYEVKQPTGFAASFILPREVGQLGPEREIRRAVLELYLMPEGARDALLGLPNGGKAWSPYLFPVAVRSNTQNPEQRAARHYRWTRGAASTRFTLLLERHGREIGLDFRRLRQVYGAGSLHVVRHLFGTRFVGVNLIKHASLMLGHGNTTITEEIYAGISTADISVDQMERKWAEAVEAGLPCATPAAPAHDGARPDFASETLELLAAHRTGLIDQRVLDEAVASLSRRYGIDGTCVSETGEGAAGLIAA